MAFAEADAIFDDNQPLRRPKRHKSSQTSNSTDLIPPKQSETIKLLVMIRFRRHQHLCRPNSKRVRALAIVNIHPAFSRTFIFCARTHTLCVVRPDLHLRCLYDSWFYWSTGQASYAPHRVQNRAAPWYDWKLVSWLISRNLSAFKVPPFAHTDTETGLHGTRRSQKGNRQPVRRLQLSEPVAKEER